jgi:hypothetical protein
VKFKIGGKEVFKSKTIFKNLNPVWDERVSLLVETLREPLYVKVGGAGRLLWTTLSGPGSWSQVGPQGGGLRYRTSGVRRDGDGPQVSVMDGSCIGQEWMAQTGRGHNTQE